MNIYIEMLLEYKDFIFIGATFLLFILSIINHFRIKKQIKNFHNIINGISGTDLEKNIISYFSDVKNMKEEVHTIKSSIQRIDEDLSISIKKISVLRYNAFDDVSSSLSFVIALLDSHDNGIVINSIYSRESTTCYSKPIQNSMSKYPLSNEEMQAIEIAKTNYIRTNKF